MSVYKIYFGEKETGYEVQYDDEIFIDSLIEQVKHIREYYPEGKLWLKRK